MNEETKEETTGESNLVNNSQVKKRFSPFCRQVSSLDSIKLLPKTKLNKVKLNY